ncbi:peptide-methionine (S)-S-oxide reductase MsrA [Cohaesibacter celericrescens]|uniref:Peptide methionine sulfoxide reductase MsrA n=1 Tax=Cohaesibacter celericrescens TaxID=2067669 RepID=A0A2N5XKA3_9HYPH|nr:peptide-methionine (S)-S-oxide reductase MsrA [Cohaesibacter celericrescens]PLW74857.1 peptide-methionine (S)-S-oxide reductase [Cohaesibacter celericrescens]
MTDTNKPKALKRFLTALVLGSALIASNGAPSFAEDNLKTAIFAGGCFWCVESDFDHVKGVVETVSGYSGGSTTENVTYRNHADHREVVKITYDATKVSYDMLLDIFWRSVDPTDDSGQFCDRGHTYTTAIYTLDEEQAKLAQASKAKLETDKTLSQPIKTEIAAAGPFFDAEDYHQDYYKVNPVRYKYYRYSCGRDADIEKLWGDQAHLGIMK